MRTLVIETATPALSVALFEGETLLAAHHEAIGRGHAERLVPTVADLPDRGRAARILVSLGPGSFTGTRIGIAAARALGIAWGAEVLGYGTLALIAAGARRKAAVPVLVAMTGGHGEWFVQPFSADGTPLQQHQAMRPADAGRYSDIELVAGSEAEALVSQRGFGQAEPLLPDARDALRLPLSSLSSRMAPIYGRPPDAIAAPPLMNDGAGG